MITTMVTCGNTLPAAEDEFVCTFPLFSVSLSNKNYLLGLEICEYESLEGIKYKKCDSG